MTQRFNQKPKNFEPTPEEVDAVLHDVFTAMHEAEKNAAVPTPPVEEDSQALVVDGQRVTADDVRRIINAFQRTRWALITTGIELNKRDQTIRRLETELGDCGYAPTYSITPFGYDVLRDMGRGS